MAVAKKPVQKPSAVVAGVELKDAGLKPVKKDSPLLAAITYLFGILIALIIYLIEKEDRFVRFHALQAIVFDIIGGGLIAVIAFVGYIVVVVIGVVTMGFGFLLMLPLILIVGVLALAFICLRLFLAYKAYKGEAYEVPKIGEFVLSKV